MWENIKREPIIITTLIANIIALGAAWGLDLTQEQSMAIQALVVTVLVIGFGRAAVTPNASVTEIKDGMLLESRQLNAVADAVKTRIEDDLRASDAYEPKHGDSLVRGS